MSVVNVGSGAHAQQCRPLGRAPEGPRGCVLVSWWRTRSVLLRGSTNTSPFPQPQEGSVASLSRQWALGPRTFLLKVVASLSVPHVPPSPACSEKMGVAVSATASPLNTVCQTGSSREERVFEMKTRITKLVAERKGHSSSGERSSGATEA